MQQKNIFTLMTTEIANALATITHDLLAIEHRSTEKTDTAGNLLPEKEESNRYEVEIPKGHGAFSKVRFSVKVLEEKLPISPEILDDEDYEITFRDLKISFIDSRKNVFFRAEGYTIVKQDTGEEVAQL